MELLELADGVGDGEEPPGLPEHRAGPQRQVAAVPSGGDEDGLARLTSAGTSTRCTTRLWPRLAGGASGSTSGSGGGGSGQAGGLRVDASGGRGRGNFDGHVAGDADPAPEGRGELVDCRPADLRTRPSGSPR